MKSRLTSPQAPLNGHGPFPATAPSVANKKHGQSEEGLVQEGTASARRHSLIVLMTAIVPRNQFWFCAADVSNRQRITSAGVKLPRWRRSISFPASLLSSSVSLSC